MEINKLHELLDDLSIEEKIGQLVQLSGEFFNVNTATTGPEKKLGINSSVVKMCGSVLNVTGAKRVHEVQDEHLKHSKIPLIFMSDIVYGYKTIYPIPLGLGATWNPKLIEEDYKNTANEAIAGGVQVTFAPMVDLVRDPRWGRVLESTGEDPYLNSEFASSMVHGLQYNFGKTQGIAACVKHFAAYGAAEGGKEYNSTDMSERQLRQNYLPSYKAAVDAGSKLVMSSFNTLNGIPVTGNKWLLKDILRNEWGFDGPIISDYAAISELTNHGFTKDEKDASKMAFDATVDIDMKSPCYANELKPLVEEGRIDIKKIDEACWRVLKLKNDMGLFEDPYRGSSELKEKRQLLTTEKRTLARKTATEASVLLKNDGILPLSSNSKVALIGPYSTSREFIGMWAIHGDINKVVSIEQAFKEHISSDDLRVTQGENILDPDLDYEAMGITSEQYSKINLTGDELKKTHRDVDKFSEWADVIVMPVGEHASQSGEAGSRSDITLPKQQVELIKRVSKFNKPIILVTLSGRPLVLSNVEPKVNAILQAWFPGTEGGHAIADILFGDANPSGRLSMGFPRSVGQLPQYYNHLSTGRSVETSSHSSRFMSKYNDVKEGPLYPFGYGLSYHKASYTNMRINNSTMMKNQKLKVSVTVTNDSDIDGTEVVQLYLQDVIASVVQPVKELRGFRKVKLLAHESKIIDFEITADMLEFYDQNNNKTLEPGRFNVYVGRSSNECLESKFDFI